MCQSPQVQEWSRTNQTICLETVTASLSAVAETFLPHLLQAQEDGHAFVAPTRIPKSRFKSGIRTDQTIRLEKPKNNLERRLRHLRRLLALP